MRVRQSVGFPDVAPLAGVVLLSACPYCLLAFLAWTRFGWVSRTVLPGVIAGGCRCLAGLPVAPASREVRVLTMSRLGIRALPGASLRLALAPAASAGYPAPRAS